MIKGFNLKNFKLPENDRILRLAAFIAVSAILIIFVLRPAVIGYSVYSNIQKTNYSLDQYGKKIDLLSTSLQVCSTNLTYCNQMNDKFLKDIEKKSEALILCNRNLSATQVLLNQTSQKYELQIQQLNDKIAAKQKEIDEIDNKYNEIIANSARTICCKMRVDNPSINSYVIEGNRIVCTDNSNNKINC